MHLPQTTYLQNIETLKAAQLILQKRKSVYGWVRLGIFLAAVLFLWQLWSFGLIVEAVVFILFALIFSTVMVKDLNNSEELENNLRLQQINQTELQVLKHRYTHLPDGLQFKPDNHDYANDLDLFGRASLYQYINRTASQQGNIMFANWLLHPAMPNEILQRQQAVKALTADVNFRQQLHAFGLAAPVTTHTQQIVDKWIAEPDKFLKNNLWHFLKYLLPAISLAILGLYISGFIPFSTFNILILIMLIGAFSITKLVMPAYLHLNKVAPQLAVLSQSIACIENKNVQAPLLQNLKAVFNGNIQPASHSIKSLKKLLDLFDIRLNPLVYVPLNTFLFWDLQLVLKLENWRKQNNTSLSNWFNALAQFECLSSLATLGFNHPQNVFPQLSTHSGVFNAQALGHPLIPANKLVVNNFSTDGLNKINLITGSNMAGKSTFLRSVGVNIVLSMMGSAVFAQQLLLSPVKVLSSMRIADNLEESTSTFYAELKKLKNVIDAVTNNEKVFLLLDEILRGTNSADRHTGSKALIKQLITKNAAGIIATHDLELAKLEQQFPQAIINHHFDVQVENNELFFDYKLKPGVCKSMNASLLMKKIGIEL
jgi:hypothetical protein